MPPKSRDGVRRQAQTNRADQQKQTEPSDASISALFAHAMWAAVAHDVDVTRRARSDELRRAILTGDDANVAKFVGCWDDGGKMDVVNEVDERGVTPLMLAARSGVKIAMLLLLRRVDVAAVDADGHTAADYALQGGHHRLAALLNALQPSKGDGGGEAGGQEEDGQMGGMRVSGARGAALQDDVVAVEHGAGLIEKAGLPSFTPLMLAARHGAVPVLRELLQQARQQDGGRSGGGCSDFGGGGGRSSGRSSGGGSSLHSMVNAVTAYNVAALHLAAECRHHAAGAAAAAATRLLLAAGANTEVRSDHHGTPLVAAVSCDNLEVVRALLEAGASPHVHDIEGLSVLDVALSRGAAEAALLLLAAGADVTLADAHGRHDPIRVGDAYIIAMSGLAAVDPESVAVLARELVARGVPLNGYHGACNLTLLIAACGAMTEACASTALLPGGHIARRGQQQQQQQGTGGGVGTKTANVATVRALLEMGADVHMSTMYGLDALHVACMAANGHEVVALLLEAGADANAARKGPKGDQQTPLSAALQSGGLATVELLLTRGKADPNARIGPEEGHTTPLLIACEQRPEAVPLLLAAGADPNLGHFRLQDPSVGRGHLVACPLMTAAGKGYEAVVAALLEAGADPLVVRAYALAAAVGRRGPAAGRQGATVGRRGAAGSLSGSTGAVAVAAGSRLALLLTASEAKTNIQRLVSSERVAALLLDAIDGKKGPVSVKLQQQQQQQQQEQRARAEAAAAQLLAEEEAEADRARAKRTTGSKGKKGKGAKGAGEGVQGVKGTAASRKAGGQQQESSGAQKDAGRAQEAGEAQNEEAAASQVESQSGGRQATAAEEESAASAVVEPQAGASSSSSSAEPTAPVVTEAEAAGDAAVGQASVLRGAAALVEAKGQPALGPKRKGGRGGTGSIPPASDAVSSLSTPPQLVATTAQLQLPGHSAVAGGRPPSDRRPPSASSLASSPLPTPSTSAVPLTPLSSSAAVVPTPPSLASMHDDGLCVVCMERRRSTVLVPCSHVVMCQACCDAVREARDECPMCREPIDAVLVIL